MGNRSWTPLRVLTGYLQQTASLVSHAPSGMLLAVFVRVLLLVCPYTIPLTHKRIRGTRMDGPRTTRRHMMDGRSSAANASSRRWTGAQSKPAHTDAVDTARSLLLSGETWSHTVYDLHRGGLCKRGSVLFCT